MINKIKIEKFYNIMMGNANKTTTKQIGIVLANKNNDNITRRKKKKMMKKFRKREQKFAFNYYRHFIYIFCMIGDRKQC